MTEAEKERMIKLLIAASDEAGESEGIWFLPHEEALELLELLIKYDPSEANVKARTEQIGWLNKVMNGNN